MGTQAYGTVDEYRQALSVVLADPKPASRLKILRLHYEAPDHTASAAELAEQMGYRTFGGVNFQYGTLAHRVGAQLCLSKPPRGFWLHVLADWADHLSPQGHTAFVLRPQVVEALEQLGVPWTAEPKRRSPGVRGE